MSIASISLRFFAAAVLGALVMSIFGIQALVEICSSIPLAKRQKRKAPDFDLPLAFRRIARRALIGALAAAGISILVIWLTNLPGTFGYLLGMILSFLKNLNRMTPNSSRNQRRFDRAYADCYEQDDEDTINLLDL